MRKYSVLVIGMLFILPLLSAERSKKEIVRIGPALMVVNCKDLSKAEVVSAGFPGFDLAWRVVDRLEIWSSYKFNKTTTEHGHGSKDIFRLDAFSIGCRYKPFPALRFKPFAGIGLDYYHFADQCGAGDDFTYFILPVKSAFGPYIQGGTYVPYNRWIEVEFFLQYNLVKRTLKRTTSWGTYHYRNDFSGMGFGLGILFLIFGK